MERRRVNDEKEQSFRKLWRPVHQKFDLLGHTISQDFVGWRETNLTAKSRGADLEKRVWSSEATLEEVDVWADWTPDQRNPYAKFLGHANIFTIAFLPACNDFRRAHVV